MSWEIISTAASVVTTLVIAATAIAAVVQIRQLKLATQLEGFLALHQEYASDEMHSSRAYVANELPKKLTNDAYRDELISGSAFAGDHPELILGNFWEKIGTLVRTGMLEPKLYLETGAYRCLEAWSQLETVVELRRMREPLQWAGFDHIVALSRDYLEKNGSAKA